MPAIDVPIWDIRETTPPPRPIMPDPFSLKVPSLLWPHPMIVLGKATGPVVEPRLMVSIARSPFENDVSP